MTKAFLKVLVSGWKYADVGSGSCYVDLFLRIHTSALLCWLLWFISDFGWNPLRHNLKVLPLLFQRTQPCPLVGRRSLTTLRSSKIWKTISTSSSMPPWMSTSIASKTPSRRCLGCQRLSQSVPLKQKKLKSRALCLFRPVSRSRMPWLMAACLPSVACVPSCGA